MNKSSNINKPTPKTKNKLNNGIKDKNKEKSLLRTNTGHRLTVKEDLFIQKYMETGNARQSVLEAGYSPKYPDQTANIILNKIYIADEIKYRQELRKKESIATGEQVMEFFSKVMRGEVKDQFGLEAPLSERLKAANELARRTVDIENKINGKADNKVTVTLNLNRGNKDE